jgi:hypoxanthine-DNA glycosylase
MTDLIGLPPIHNSSARILILGSMPGAESLQQQHYYAHPRNQFWIILSSILSSAPALTEISYPEKQAKLLESNIALWDVIHRCQRPGSLDTSIELDSIRVNSFSEFFAEHLQLDSVFFNGRKAQQIFTQLVYPELSTQYQKLNYFTLPSTSPAHAAMRLPQKKQAWSIISQSLSALNEREP